LQAETDRIFDEIQKRKEKEAKESGHLKDGKTVTSFISCKKLASLELIFLMLTFLCLLLPFSLLLQLFGFMSFTSNYCRMVDLIMKNQIEKQKEVLIFDLEMRMEAV